jgi:hypothetical protein
MQRNRGVIAAQLIGVKFQMIEIAENKPLAFLNGIHHQGRQSHNIAGVCN